MAEWTWLIIALLATALVLSQVLLLRRPAVLESPPSPVRTPGKLAQLDSVGQALAVLEAELAPDDLIVASVPDEPAYAIVRGSPERAKALGVVVGDVPRQLLRVAVPVHGVVSAGVAVGEHAGKLVRLTAESAAMLRELGGTKDAGGAILGVLQGSSGKFAHVIRFKPASGLVAISGVTGALAAIAMQSQLAAIERQLADVTLDVRRIEKTLELEAQAEVAALKSLFRETYSAANGAGELTEAMWDQVAPLGYLVRKHEEYADRRLSMLVDELEAQNGIKEKRRWLDQHGLRLRQAFEVVQSQGRVSVQYAALRLWRLVLLDDPSTRYYVNQLREMAPTRAAIVSRMGRAVDAALDESGRAANSRWWWINPWDAIALGRLSTDLRTALAQVQSPAGDSGTSRPRLADSGAATERLKAPTRTPSPGDDHDDSDTPL